MKTKFRIVEMENGLYMIQKKSIFTFFIWRNVYTRAFIGLENAKLELTAQTTHQLPIKQVIEEV